MLYNGNNSNLFFNIHSNWDGGRNREVHVYLKNTTTGKFDETTAFTLDRVTVPHRVVMNTAPPSGVDNVMVASARDPFPEYTWQMNPPIAGWYVGPGGPNTGSGVTGSHGFVHMPWTPACVTWMRNFMAAFQSQWTAAIAAGTLPADAIESISIQESANALVNDTNAGAYRAGLLEYAKFNAKAVRRRAFHGQLLNGIPKGGH